jgi:hypothetical protein
VVVALLRGWVMCVVVVGVRGVVVVQGVGESSWGKMEAARDDTKGVVLCRFSFVFDVLRLRVKKGEEVDGGVREVLFLFMTVLCFFMTVVEVVLFEGDVNKGN